MCASPISFDATHLLRAVNIVPGTGQIGRTPSSWVYRERSMTSNVVFTAEDGEMFTSLSEADERDVFTSFRQRFVPAADLTDGSKMLFKITIDDGTKSKSVCWLGVPHVTSFADVLALLNKRYAGNGAFLLKGGYGIRPQQSAGQIFMKYGYELEFHPKVDLTRIAWHQRG